MLEVQSVVVAIRRRIKAALLGAAVPVADTARRGRLEPVLLDMGAVPLQEQLGFLKGSGAGRTICALGLCNGMTASRALSQKVRFAQHRNEL
jgi:hypothetical protein